MTSDDDFLAKLEADGEDQVRYDLAKGLYGPHRKGMVEEWLRRRDQSRSERSARRKTRYDKIAAIAAIMAAVAATVSAIASIIGLL